MRLSIFWFAGKEKADFWRKHSQLSHTKHALASSLIYFFICSLFCSFYVDVVMHFVFTPVTFNDICIEHFSKYCVKKIFFKTECHLQEQNSRKKESRVHLIPRITTWQINSCLPHSCKNLSTIPPLHRLFIYIIASRRGTWEHELSLVLKPLWLVNDHLKDSLALVMLIILLENSIG